MGDASGESVYERVLGDDFERLAPELMRYFSLPPQGMHGEADGMFEVAGCRRGWLRPFFAPLAPLHILFPEYGEDVPFHVENRPAGAATG